MGSLRAGPGQIHLIFAPCLHQAPHHTRCSTNTWWVDLPLKGQYEHSLTLGKSSTPRSHYSSQFCLLLGYRELCLPAQCPHSKAQPARALGEPTRVGLPSSSGWKWNFTCLGAALSPSPSCSPSPAGARYSGAGAETRDHLQPVCTLKSPNQ